MQTPQIIPAEIPADSSSLLGRYGEYEIYPIQVCSEDQIAGLFVKVCQRGNPLLQGRPEQDLTLLGRAFYRKCMPLGMGQVALHKGEPVAFSSYWDIADGGVWQGSGFEIPESLEAHAAVGKAAFACLPKGDESRLFFPAFVGVNPPHTGKVFGILTMIGFLMAKAFGFEKSLNYSVLDKSVLARLRPDGKAHKSMVDTEFHKGIGPVVFAEVAAEKEATRAELKKLDGMARVTLAHMSFCVSDLWYQAIADSCRATPEELKEFSPPMAERQLEILKGRSAAPKSKL